jgi:UDP-glucose 4-epimerase
MKQLFLNPSKLTVLGDGHQRKSYLHVSDCIRAIHIALDKTKDQINILNLGVNGFCEVRESVAWILDELQTDPVVTYGSSNKGWVGDNPFIYLDTNQINSFGWVPKFSIEESVRDTVRFLIDNRHLVLSR